MLVKRKDLVSCLIKKINQSIVKMDTIAFAIVSPASNHLSVHPNTWRESIFASLFTKISVITIGRSDNVIMLMISCKDIFILLMIR